MLLWNVTAAEECLGKVLEEDEEEEEEKKQERETGERDTRIVEEQHWLPLICMCV